MVENVNDTIPPPVLVIPPLGRGLTNTLNVWLAVKAGRPLSVTLTVIWLDPAWPVVGVHWNTPLAGPMLAPIGAVGRLKVRFWPASGSLALAVKLTVWPA